MGQRNENEWWLSVMKEGDPIWFNGLEPGGDRGEPHRFLGRVPKGHHREGQPVFIATKPEQDIHGDPVEPRPKVSLFMLPVPALSKPYNDLNAGLYAHLTSTPLGRRIVLERSWEYLKRRREEPRYPATPIEELVDAAALAEDPSY